VKRIDSLDGLRGIAALGVVVAHALPVGLPQVPDVIAIAMGRACVIAFFVLSGFVLSLPYFEGRPLAYPAFVIRRICRIYLPYACVMLVAAVLFYTVWGQGAHHDFYEVVSGATLLHSALMLGTTHGLSLDPPTWSLVVEMRYSLLFPLLVLAMVRIPRAAMILTIAGALALYIVPVQLNFNWYELYDPIGMKTFVGSLATTTYYAPMFLGGILLAKHAGAMPDLIRRHGPLLWAAAIACLAIGAFRDPVIGVAAVLLVALVPHTPPVARALTWKPVLWLGRVSYSLYLVHLVILLGLLRSMSNPLLAALLVLPLSLIAAEVFHRYVEVPSNKLGARIVALRFH
jgi:peptidoglycan/LPS O-acetylase OafA/YrhL